MSKTTELKQLLNKKMDITELETKLENVAKPTTKVALQQYTELQQRLSNAQDLRSTLKKVSEEMLSKFTDKSMKNITETITKLREIKIDCEEATNLMQMFQAITKIIQKLKTMFASQNTTTNKKQQQQEDEKQEPTEETTTEFQNLASMVIETTKLLDSCTDISKLKSAASYSNLQTTIQDLKAFNIVDTKFVAFITRIEALIWAKEVDLCLSVLNSNTTTTTVASSKQMTKQQLSNKHTNNSNMPTPTLDSLIQTQLKFDSLKKTNKIVKEACSNLKSLQEELSAFQKIVNDFESKKTENFIQEQYENAPKLFVNTPITPAATKKNKQNQLQMPNEQIQIFIKEIEEILSLSKQLSQPLQVLTLVSQIQSQFSEQLKYLQWSVEVFQILKEKKGSLNKKECQSLIESAKQQKVAETFYLVQQMNDQCTKKNTQISKQNLKNILGDDSMTSLTETQQKDTKKKNSKNSKKQQVIEPQQIEEELVEIEEPMNDQIEQEPIIEPETKKTKKLTKKQQQQQQQLQQQAQQQQQLQQQQQQQPQQMEIEVEKKPLNKKTQQITLKKWHQLKNQIIKKMEMCVEVIDNELCIKDKQLFDSIESEFPQLVAIVTSNQVTLSDKDKKEYDNLDMEISLYLLLLQNDRKQRVDMWERILEVLKSSSDLKNQQFYLSKVEMEINLYNKLLDAFDEIYATTQSLTNKTSRKNLRTCEDQNMLNEGISNCRIAIDQDKIVFLNGLMKQSDEISKFYAELSKKFNTKKKGGDKKISKDELIQMQQMFRKCPFYFTSQEQKIEAALEDIDKLEKKLQQASSQKQKDQVFKAYKTCSYTIPAFETIISDQQQAKKTLETAADQCQKQLQKLSVLQDTEFTTFSQVQESENLMILINDNLESLKPLQHPQLEQFVQSLEKHKTQFYLQLFSFIKNNWDRENTIDGLDRKFLKIKTLELDSLIKSDAGGFENDRLKIAKFFIEDILKKIEDTILDISNLKDHLEITKFKPKIGFFNLTSYLSEQKSQLKVNSSLNLASDKSKQSATETSLTKKQQKQTLKNSQKQQKQQQQQKMSNLFEENTMQEDEKLLDELVGGDLSDIKPENNNNHLHTNNNNKDADEEFQLTDNDLEIMHQDNIENDNYKQANKKNLKKLKKKSQQQLTIESSDTTAATKKEDKSKKTLEEEEPAQKMTETQIKTKVIVHKIAFLIKNNTHWSSIFSQLEIMEFAVKLLNYYEKTYSKDSKMLNYHVQSLCQFLYKLQQYPAISQKIAKSQFSLELVNTLKVKTNLILDNLERKEVIVNAEEKRQMEELDDEYYFSKEQLKKKANKKQQLRRREDDGQNEQQNDEEDLSREEDEEEEYYDSEDEDQQDIIDEKEIAVYKIFSGNLKHSDFKTMPQAQLISHTKSIIVRQFPAIVKQIMDMQESMPQSSFYAYLTNIYKQEQETQQRKKEKIVSGWVESDIDIHQNIIDIMAEKMLESQTVSIINCGTNLNLYLMNVHQMPQDTKKQLYFTQYQHISSIRAASPMMFVLIYSGSKIVNKNSDYTLQAEIMTNYVDARLKNNNINNNSFHNNNNKQQQQSNFNNNNTNTNNNNNNGMIIKRFFQLAGNLPQNQLMILLNTVYRTFSDQNKIRQIMSQHNRQAQSNLQSNIVLTDLRNNTNLDFKAIQPQALEIFATNPLFRTNTNLIQRLIQIAKNKYNNPHKNTNQMNQQSQQQQQQRFNNRQQNNNMMTNKENNMNNNNYQQQGNFQQKNYNSNYYNNNNNYNNRQSQQRIEFAEINQNQNSNYNNNNNNNFNNNNRKPYYNNNYNNKNQGQPLMKRSYNNYYQNDQQNENDSKFVYSTENQPSNKALERFNTARFSNQTNNIY